MFQAFRPAAVIAGAVLLVAGCGGGGDSKEAEAPRTLLPYAGTYKGACRTGLDASIETIVVTVNSATPTKGTSVTRFDYYNNDACTGSPIGTVTYPADQLSLEGSTQAAGAAADKILLVEGSGAVTYSGPEARDDGVNVEVNVFSSGSQSYVDVVALSYTGATHRLLFQLSGNKLYMGSTSLGPDGYPTALGADFYTKQ